MAKQMFSPEVVDWLKENNADLTIEPGRGPNKVEIFITERGNKKCLRVGEGFGLTPDAAYLAATRDYLDDDEEDDPDLDDLDE